MGSAGFLGSPAYSNRQSFILVEFLSIERGNTVTLPYELEGLGLFFAMLDSTPKEINDWQKLQKMQPFIDSAMLEHNRLMAFAENTAAHPQTAELAACMAECFAALAGALAGRQHEIRRVLMGAGR